LVAPSSIVELSGGGLRSTCPSDPPDDDEEDDDDDDDDDDDTPVSNDEHARISVVTESVPTAQAPTFIKKKFITSSSTSALRACMLVDNDDLSLPTHQTHHFACRVTRIERRTTDRSRVTDGKSDSFFKCRSNTVPLSWSTNHETESVRELGLEIVSKIIGALHKVSPK